MKNQSIIRNNTLRLSFLLLVSLAFSVSWTPRAALAHKGELCFIGVVPDLTCPIQCSLCNTNTTCIELCGIGNASGTCISRPGLTDICECRCN